MRFLEYMRAHGNTPGRLQKPLTAGAIAGAIAALPGAAISWQGGIISETSRGMELAPAAVLALAVAWMIVMAMIYARVFGRAANDHRAGWMLGTCYGFILWVLGPIAVLELFGVRLEGAEARHAMLGFLAYGLSLGVIYPIVHAPFLRAAWRIAAREEEEESRKKRSIFPLPAPLRRVLHGQDG